MGLDSTSTYRSERMSTHVVPSSVLTTMSTTISSSSPASRRISIEPCRSPGAVDNQTLSTAAGTMSRGFELSTRRATWTAASSSAAVDSSVAQTLATRPPGVARNASIDQANGWPSMPHASRSSAAESDSFPALSYWSSSVLPTTASEVPRLTSGGDKRPLTCLTQW